MTAFTATVLGAVIGVALSLVAPILVAPEYYFGPQP